MSIINTVVLVRNIRVHMLRMKGVNLAARAVARVLLEGGQLRPYKFVKKISAKLDKTSLNFKNFQKFL